MTRLRQLMLEELHRRNYADSTIRVYIRTVVYFNQYFRRPPVIQGKFKHTFKGAAPQAAGRDPCGRNLRDRSMMTSAEMAPPASSSCISTASSTSSRWT